MIAIVVAHPDDEVLAFGGAMARASDAGEKLRCLFVADGVGARDQRGAEEALKRREGMAQQASAILGCGEPHFLRLADNALDSLPLLEVVKAIESVLAVWAPTQVWTHHAGDLNVDHRVVARAVLTACRPQPGRQVARILAGEVLSATGWSDPQRDAFRPSRFVGIAPFLERKLEAMRAYDAELREWPHARSEGALRALAETRGALVGLPAAEAFEVIRDLEL